MSRAFVKEDIDAGEIRSGRRRSVSGLPPGARNYMTADGARLLRERMARAGHSDAAEIARTLDSATIVEARPARNVAAFGSKVTIRRADGSEETLRIVGADEVGLHPGGVSWVSPVGRALLGAEAGQRVDLGDGPGRKATVIGIEP